MELILLSIFVFWVIGILLCHYEPSEKQKAKLLIETQAIMSRIIAKENRKKR